MSEIVRVSTKKPEGNRENHVSKIQKICPSQSISSPVEQILFLQRTIGNQAVVKLIKSGALQAKLRIGQPGDIYEQEADRVADAVMRMPSPQAVSSNTSRIQRACPGCKEDELRRELKEEEGEEKLQARGASSQTPQVTPDVENSINSMRGGGQPLPESSRTFFEPRFGADFSNVRVHTDTKAAEAARGMNAKAFTIGKDLVFGEGEYTHNTSEGQRLLAHELTHVVQQSNRRNTQNVTEPSLQRQLKASEFPGFSQGDYATCGAASVVSALVIWDRERKDPKPPNNMVVAACDNVLIDMDDNHRTLVETLDKVEIKGIEKGSGEEIYQEIFNAITEIRDTARQPGAQITENQYQKLGLALYVLHHSGERPGLQKYAGETLLKRIGLTSKDSKFANTFEDILSSASLQGLNPGQIAQVTWYARVGQPDARGNIPLNMHAFLIGRFQRGTWFVSDQGTRPPTELEAPDLNSLKATIYNEVAAGRSKIHTGTVPLILNAWTGVVMLGERSGVEKKAESVAITPGAFLAEVDAGFFTEGSRIFAESFIARSYSMAEALKAISGIGSGHGGVIVENPVGLFHIYRTTTVSDDNLTVKDIDQTDSSGGLLSTPNRFYHAWLMLCTSKKCNTSILRVY